MKKAWQNSWNLDISIYMIAIIIIISCSYFDPGLLLILITGTLLYFQDTLHPSNLK